MNNDNKYKLTIAIGSENQWFCINDNLDKIKISEEEKGRCLTIQEMIPEMEREGDDCFELGVSDLGPILYAGIYECIPEIVNNSEDDWDYSVVLKDFKLIVTFDEIIEFYTHCGKIVTENFTRWFNRITDRLKEKTN